MLDLTDWNCELLSGVRVSEDLDVSETIETMQFMRENHGFSRFCMMPIYDCVKEPVSIFLVKRTSYENAVSCQLPTSLFVRYSAKVLLRKGLSEIADLKKLTDQTAGYLPLMMPVAEYRDWIDEELNQLLYKKHFKLLIMSCELIPYLYPKEATERIFRIKNAAYQFQYSSLAEPKIRRLVYNLLHSGKTVLLGSGISSLRGAWNFDLPYYRACAKELFLKSELEITEQFCRYFWKK